jgi:hypothetical protein
VAIWIRVIAGVLGLALQCFVLDAAIRTFLLPRVANVRLSRWIASSVSTVFRLLAKPERTYAYRDRVLSIYPSIVLLSYQATWLFLSLLAFTGLFVAAGVRRVGTAAAIAGSSLFTLGSRAGEGDVQELLTVIAAGVGLTLLALLIAFIPALYAAFQRREFSVSRLTVRAGIPATPWGILEIAQSVDSYARLEELWTEWEQWFIDVGETHTTLTILNFYRSPSPDQTWIGSAASVLDAAALFNAAIDVTPSPSAGLCIRAGWLTLRRLADYFNISYPTSGDRTTPIAITREQFDIVLARLERSGIPVLADRDTAWHDFVGWRVNYDAIMEALYDLFSCPRADWTLAAVEPLVAKSNVRGATT